MSSPTCLHCCLEGKDINYCQCSDIVDEQSFKFCLGRCMKLKLTLKEIHVGPRPKAIVVATGVDDNENGMTSVEILIRNKDGMYESKTQESCSVPNYPIATSSATGAFFNGMASICPGYVKGGQRDECFGLKNNGSWVKIGLIRPLYQWASSVLLNNSSLWWLVGSDPDGKETIILENNSSHWNQMTNGWDLPLIMNQPCMVAIDDDRVFVSAIPKYEAASTNLAWIFNRKDKSWTQLPNTREKRYGPSCGYLDSDLGPSIVLAGGWGISATTTEILNLDSKKWTNGPKMKDNAFGGTMVSLVDEKELLLLGGYTSEALPRVLKMNSSMASWEKAGVLKTPRYSSVAIAVPVENLPPQIDIVCA